MHYIIVLGFYALLICLQLLMPTSSSLSLSAAAVALTTTTSSSAATIDFNIFEYPYSNSTEFTGIRQVPQSKDLVYISGFTYFAPQSFNDTANFKGLLYVGPLTGGGYYVNNFTYPDPTVIGTNLYGPNSPRENDPTYIQLAGSYTLEATGGVDYGCLYQGYINGSGSWITLTPSKEFKMLGSIAHR